MLTRFPNRPELADLPETPDSHSHSCIQYSHKRVPWYAATFVIASAI